MTATNEEWRGLEKTYAMIKPDAVAAGKVDDILKIAEDAGFVVVRRQEQRMDAVRAGEFYAEHKGKPFYANLVGFMSSGPIVACCLAKHNAIKDWRALMGPTNTFTAREDAPKSLRAKFGTDGTRNATHGSDSPASAMRELKFFFPNLRLDPIPEGAAAREYVARELQPTLVQALAALAKEKPSANKLEAVAWLAAWLRANNPNNPPSYSEAELPLNPDDEAASDGEFFETVAATADAQDAANVVDALDDLEEMAKAATKVQSHFRGHQARRTAAQRRRDALGGGRKETTIAVESHTDVVGLMEGDPEELARAAATVQASYRGHKARREVARLRADADAVAAAAMSGSGEAALAAAALFEGTEEEQSAAVKLQSNFRGHMARREVAAERARAEEEAELAQAATRVQAGFRGHLARKQVAGMKGGDA
uniref:Nucleoside diphosphate kinase-like domain-containing protein n=1 Tax=Micromonas pusilla TaxID=38833 RepID=A0A7S0KFH5_MICPS